MGLHIAGSATVTIKGSDGKPIQVPQAVVAQAQLGLLQPSPDGTISLPGPDGKLVKIPQAALAAATPAVLPSMAAGNYIKENKKIPRIVKMQKKEKVLFLKKYRNNTKSQSRSFHCLFKNPVRLQKPFTLSMVEMVVHF